MRLVVADFTSDQTDFSRSRSTERNEPQRSVIAQAATPSRSEVEPETFVVGSGFFRKYASTWRKSVVRGGRMSNSGPPVPATSSHVPASSISSSFTLIVSEAGIAIYYLPMMLK
jgi:hypothetical protein